MARVIAHCRQTGTAKLGIQIAHAGRKASAQRPWEGGGALPAGADPWETIAPSPIPFGPNWHVPRVATLEDIARVREAFVNSAKRAVRIGFDAIELHYAHGYLAHSFLSPVSNHRTDQYGGSLENRMRFGLEIANAVRTAVPKSIALGARITGNDWRDDGLSTEDAVTYSHGAQGRRPRLHRRVVRRHHRRHPQSDADWATTCRSPSGSSARSVSRLAWSG